MATKSSSSGASGALATALAIVLPKKPKPGGAAATPTVNLSAPQQILTLPTYNEHMTDIFAQRSATDSRALMKLLFVQDPDISAALNAFLTVADTQMRCICRDANGVIDRPGQVILNNIIEAFEVRSDYSKGFQLRPSFSAIREAMRYMVLLRGAIPVELVFDKVFNVQEFRLIEPGTLNWVEPTPGVYQPQQKNADGSIVSLDIPTFFIGYFRKDPTTIYTYSTFVSAINTIAARQQVINDLYRIMQLTGYPRLEVTVLEEVLMANAPLEVKTDQTKKANYVNSQIATIRSSVANIRPDQAFVHTDSVTVGVVNDKSPGMSLDISKIIDTLNSQNQAGLKIMGTMLGRGNAGVNTASVEARMFSMTAEQLNKPIADLFSQMLTLVLRLNGSQSSVAVTFDPVELRPLTELEPQLTMRASRLKSDLSLGIIDDDEYHWQMYGRIRPDSAPILSGTNFMPATNANVVSAGDQAALDSADTGAGAGTAATGPKDPNAPDATKVSPNTDPLGRSASAKGAKSARSNGVKP